MGQATQEKSWEEKKENLLSISESAEFVGISVDTLRRWENKGRIEAHRSPGGHRYFDKDDLRELFGKKYTRIEDETETEKEEQPEEKPLETQDVDSNDTPDQKDDIADSESISTASAKEEVEEEESTTNGEQKRPVSKVLIPPQTPVRIKNRQVSSMRELDMEFISYSKTTISTTTQESSPQDPKQTEPKSGQSQQKSVLEPEQKSEINIQKFTPLEKQDEKTASKTNDTQTTGSAKDTAVNKEGTKTTPEQRSKRSKTTYFKIGAIVLITLLTLALAIFSLIRLQSTTPIISPVP